MKQFNERESERERVSVHVSVLCVRDWWQTSRLSSLNLQFQLTFCNFSMGAVLVRLCEKFGTLLKSRSWNGSLLLRLGDTVSEIVSARVLAIRIWERLAYGAVNP